MFVYLFATLISSLALAAALPLASPSGFSLHVAEARHGKRDFVHDWAAARQKWGQGVPEDVVSMFSLADGSESPRLLPKEGLS